MREPRIDVRVWNDIQATATVDGRTFGPMTLAEARAMQDEAFEQLEHFIVTGSRGIKETAVDIARLYRIASAIIDGLTGVER